MFALYRIADFEQLNLNLGINEYKPIPERKRRSFKKLDIVRACGYILELLIP